MTTVVMDKKADLAGPGIGDYAELEKILPADYASLLDREGDAEGDLRGSRRYIEEQPLQGAEPDDGHRCR